MGCAPRLEQWEKAEVGEEMKGPEGGEPKIRVETGGGEDRREGIKGGVREEEGGKEKQPSLQCH